MTEAIAKTKSIQFLQLFFLLKNYLFSFYIASKSFLLHLLVAKHTVSHVQFVQDRNDKMCLLKQAMLSYKISMLKFYKFAL